MSQPKNTTTHRVGDVRQKRDDTKDPVLPPSPRVSTPSSASLGHGSNDQQDRTPPATPDRRGPVRVEQGSTLTIVEDTSAGTNAERFKKDIDRLQQLINDLEAAVKKIDIKVDAILDNRTSGQVDSPRLPSSPTIGSPSTRRQTAGEYTRQDQRSYYYKEQIINFLDGRGLTSPRTPIAYGYFIENSKIMYEAKGGRVHPTDSPSPYKCPTCNQYHWSIYPCQA
ncbi:hypothetical protein HK405_002724 [Cladochytrium tenue]|nr:hypothetical protein HK405_002724 [Cladochytrium tenue]